MHSKTYAGDITSRKQNSLTHPRDKQPSATVLPHVFVNQCSLTLYFIKEGPDFEA